MYLFFAFNIWLHFSLEFFCQFTPRSSASEEDDKEDSAWEPQKKVPRSRKQAVPKEAKPKRVPQVKKNTLQISGDSEGVAVKEELVGGFAGQRECYWLPSVWCSFFLTWSRTKQVNDKNFRAMVSSAIALNSIHQQIHCVGEEGIFINWYIYIYICFNISKQYHSNLD